MIFTESGWYNAGLIWLFDERRARASGRAVRQAGRHDPAEVAPEHLRGRHDEVVRQRHVEVVGRLDPEEEEQLVPHHGPADRPAELMPLQPVVAPQSAVLRALEVANRVEPMIARELEDVAVELVGARLGDGIHRRAARQARSRVTHARFGPELLQRVRKRNRVAGVDLRIVVVAAVDEIQRGIAKRPRDRDLDGRAARDPIGEATDGRLDGSTRKQNQLRGVATVQRQAHHLILGHERADRETARLDHVRVGLHLYRLATRRRPS